MCARVCERERKNPPEGRTGPGPRSSRGQPGRTAEAAETGRVLTTAATGHHGFRADPWPRTGIRNPRARGERSLSACGLEDSPTGRYGTRARVGLRPPDTPPPDTNKKQGSRTGIGPARTEGVQLDCRPGNEILRRENARGSPFRWDARRTKASGLRSAR